MLPVSPKHADIGRFAVELSMIVTAARAPLDPGAPAKPLAINGAVHNLAA
jgi:hypothetical protein